MRLGRVRCDGEVLLVRVEEGHAPVPLLVEQAAPGCDPLRELLAAFPDPHDAPAVRDPLTRGSWHVLCPVRAPEKVLAIGLNYADHARESGAALPETPLLFAKTPNSLIGPDDEIVWRAADADQVDYEAELAVVMGRRAHRVDQRDALSYVLGYTACNDVSARDVQFADGQWTRGKSFDTFCPLGPWIVTTDEVPDPQSLAVRCRVNGELLQDGTTADMVFGVADLVARLSMVMTLEPGDVIATGTPVGVGFARTPPIFLRDGDVVEIDIEGLDVLRNGVRVQR